MIPRGVTLGLDPRAGFRDRSPSDLKRTVVLGSASLRSLAEDDEVCSVKNFGDMMKQAQAMQQKLQDAQAKLAEAEVEGASGGGLVKLTLTGGGELKAVSVDDSLLQPGEGEVLSDLLVAAHADAKKKLDASQAEMMQQVAGPLAGALGGIPGLKL